MAKEWPGFFYRGSYFTDTMYTIDTLKTAPMEIWDVRPDDVIVVNYVRSGTYWLTKALTCLFPDLNFVLPQTGKVVRLDQLCEDNDDLPSSYREIATAVKESLHEMKSPRLLVCHFPPQLFPKVWRDGQKKCRIIYVTRNPKDVCVSQYLHMNTIPAQKMDLTWEEWVKAFIEGRVKHGPWLDHVLGWKRYGLQDNVLHVTFEDMKKDLESVLTDIALFLGQPKSEEELRNAAKCCTFDAMSQGVDFYRTYSASGVKGYFSSTGRHARKGRVGDWKEHFTVAQNEHFDQQITEKAKQDGLEFVFEM
ncbi:amine sulfotransferase-like [Ptychodera flava]|uniref:amine sulfotransferase-like n=1 Tax=Ptychodera flava TaxID=63121 RepID=UPI00396A2606